MPARQPEQDVDQFCADALDFAGGIPAVFGTR